MRSHALTPSMEVTEASKFTPVKLWRMWSTHSHPALVEKAHFCDAVILPELPSHSVLSDFDVVGKLSCCDQPSPLTLRQRSETDPPTKSSQSSSLLAGDGTIF